MRAAVRAHVWVEGPDGGDRYNNRAVRFVNTAWGRIRAQEDYEDCERAAAFDAASSATGTPDRGEDAFE